ncbi:NINE protein [Rhodococcus sp. 3Y1]
MTGEPYSDKSKTTAGLLGILLGGFGAGRFISTSPAWLSHRSRSLG